MDGHYLFNKRFNHTYDIFRYVFYTSDNTWFYNFIYGYMGLFDIYSKEHRRVIMAQETIKEMLKMIDAKIEHIEDISADNRAVIIKLVKQSNQICEYLKQMEIEVVETYDSEDSLPFSANLPKEKLSELKDLFDDFQNRKEELKEFEEELKKHKDKLTPGQVGES